MTRVIALALPVVVVWPFVAWMMEGDGTDGFGYLFVALCIAPCVALAHGTYLGLTWARLTRQDHRADERGERVGRALGGLAVAAVFVLLVMLSAIASMGP